MRRHAHWWVLFSLGCSSLKPGSDRFDCGGNNQPCCARQRCDGSRVCEPRSGETTPTCR